MKKERGKREGGPKSKNAGASKVLERIRDLSLLVNADAFPIELLEEVRWMIDRGLEKRVWNLLEEDLPEESFDAIVYAVRLAASRLTLLGTQVSPATGEEEPQPMVLIPFGLLFSATFLAGEAAQFPTELPDTIRRAVESGLLRQSLGLPDDVMLFLDPRLYRPDHDAWLRPSVTRSYMNSIAAHLERPSTPVAPLTMHYKRRSRPGSDELLWGEVDTCQRLICGAIITDVGKGAEALADADKLLFGDRDDESSVEQDRFQEFDKLIEDELAGRCRMTQFTVMANPMPIELWNVPRFVFQVQRSVSLGLTMEMALEDMQEETDPGRELKSVLYVSMHGHEETLQEFRYAAYLVDEQGTEEESPFFTYAWEIAFDLEAPIDIDEAVGEIAARLNASVSTVEGLRLDEECDNCGAKLFCGPGGKTYHDRADMEECTLPYEN